MRAPEASISQLSKLGRKFSNGLALPCNSWLASHRHVLGVAASEYKQGDSKG